MHAQTSKKRRITSAMHSGSAKKLTSLDNYFGMPTVLTSADGDTLVTDQEAIKSVTQDYWSKLYTWQNTPDVPEPWLSTPSVTEVYK